VWRKVASSDHRKVPSHVAKVSRAKTHLECLKTAIETYSGTDLRSYPYAGRHSIEGKPKRDVFRVHFFRAVSNTDIPLIAADAIYNLRSSLEHLMAAMVPAKNRDSVTFPVFWRGVWDPCVTGESEQRRRDRQRWLTIARALPTEATAYLKKLQPPDEPVDAQTCHQLRILNQLSNTDRHTRLPVFAEGLGAMMVRNYMKDGSFRDGIGRVHPGAFIEDNAEIDVPAGTVRVEIAGIPQIVIRTQMKYPDGRPQDLPIVDFISDSIKFFEDEVFPSLARFVRPRQ